MKTVSFTVNAEAFHFITKQARSLGRTFPEHIEIVLDRSAQEFARGRIKFDPGRMPGDVLLQYRQFRTGPDLRKSLKLDDSFYAQIDAFAERNSFSQIGRFVSWFAKSVLFLQLVDWIEGTQETITICAQEDMTITADQWYNRCESDYTMRLMKANEDYKAQDSSTFEDWCLLLRGTRPRFGKYEKLSFKMKPSGSTGIALEYPAVEITDLDAFKEHLARRSDMPLKEALWTLAKCGKLAAPEPVFIPFPSDPRPVASTCER